MTVRLTVHPAEDVVLSDGVPASAFRSPLAALLRRPELRHAPLLADGVPVPEDRGAGERPLLPGAVITLPGRTTSDGGPDGTASDADAGTGGLTTTGVVGRLARRLIRRRTGSMLRVLSPPRQRPDPWWLLGLLPVVASVALAIALRQPILAVFALAGLAAVIPQLVRRRSGAGPDLPGPHRGGPAALAAFVTAARQCPAETWETARTIWTGKTPHPPGWPGGLWNDLLTDQAVAVVGPIQDARGVARAIVADLAVQGRPIRVLGDVPAWNWCRWLTTPEHNATGPTAAPVLVVDHGRAAAPATTSHMSTPETTTIVVGAVGACRTVLTVDGGRMHPRGPDVRRRARRAPAVTTTWAEHFARHLAGARHLGRTVATLTGQATTTPGRALPDDVPLLSLHETAAIPAGQIHDAFRSTRCDQSTPPDWTVPLGRGARGTVSWDLVAEGPHLLIAGTTGSGKSELLRALILGLAIRHPPTRLTLGLIDFKGGAGLGALTTLPHVTGHVTDLDPALAERALVGLSAELRRRKEILARHGVADLADLTPASLPRLVVVVDEFRALADELPRFVPELVRIAAQGRSLGLHLVLATQRPSGAVSADVRANITTRLALRVTDPLESRDIVDCPDAAHLPMNRPGRAVLRVGTAPEVMLQCAHTEAGRSGPVVRRARPMRPSPDTTAQAHGGKNGGEERDRRPPRSDHIPLTRLVAALRHQYHPADSAPARSPLWLPPLPARIGPAELAAHEAPTPPTSPKPAGARRAISPAPRPGLPLALGDLPEQQRRTVIRWDPAEGNLAILGPARSGRSMALAALADAALARDQKVHAAISGPPNRHPLGTLIARPGMTISQIHELPRLLGGTVDPDGHHTDHRRQEARQILLIDDLDLLRATHPGWQPPHSSPIAFAGSGPGGLQALRAGPRLILLSRDRAGDVALGAPASLAGNGGLPGRGAWCGRTEFVLCQVVAIEPTTCGKHL